MADTEKHHNEEGSTVNRGRPSDNQRKVRIATVILMTVNLVLLVAFGSLVLHWRAKRIRALEPVESRVCVPSSEFNNNTCPDGTDLGTAKDCCGGASKILKGMLPMELNKTFKEHRPTRLLSEAKLNCTKTDRQISKCNMAGLDPKTLLQDAESPLHWKSAQSDRDCYEYLHGKVYIKETGHYFVHSQIKLSPPEVDNSTEASVTYSHYVQHFSQWNQSTKTVLKNTKNFCMRPGLKHNTTMSTGAVIRLKKRDHVYVTTSHPGHLVPCDHDNRLTLYMMK